MQRNKNKKSASTSTYSSSSSYIEQEYRNVNNFQPFSSNSSQEPFDPFPFNFDNVQIRRHPNSQHFNPQRDHTQRPFHQDRYQTNEPQKSPSYYNQFKLTPHQLGKMILNKEKNGRHLGLSYLHGLASQIYFSASKSFSPSLFLSQLSYFTELRPIICSQDCQIYVKHLCAISLIPKNPFILSSLHTYILDISQITQEDSISCSSVAHIIISVTNFYKKYSEMIYQNKALLLQIIGFFWNSPFCSYELLEIVNEVSQGGEHDFVVIQKFNGISGRVFDFEIYAEIDKAQIVGLISSISGRILKLSSEEINNSFDVIYDFFCYSLRILEEVRSVIPGYQQFTISLSKSSHNYYCLLKPFIQSILKQYPLFFLTLGIDHLKKYLILTATSFVEFFKIAVDYLMLEERLDGITLELVHEVLMELDGWALSNVFRVWKKEGTLEELERVLERSKGEGRRMEGIVEEIKGMYGQYTL